MKTMHRPAVSIQDVWKTWLHWNNWISINDLKTDVIVLAFSMFVNMKLYLLNDTIFSKIIKHVVMKEKQTYIERLSLIVSFVFPFTSIIMLKMFSNTFFLCAWHQGYNGGDWYSNNETLRKYFTIPNCR